MRFERNDSMDAEEAENYSRSKANFDLTPLNYFPKSIPNLRNEIILIVCEIEP